VHTLRTVCKWNRIDGVRVFGARSKSTIFNELKRRLKAGVDKTLCPSTQTVAFLQELALFSRHVYYNPGLRLLRHLLGGHDRTRLMNVPRCTNRCNCCLSPHFAFLPFLPTSVFRVYLTATSLPGTFASPLSLPLTQPLSPERPEEKCCYTGLRETSLAGDLCLSNIVL